MAREAEISVLLEEARVHAAAGRLVESQATLSRVLEIEPLHSEANFQLGQIAEHQRRADDALKHYVRAIERPSPMRDAFVRLAALHSGRGREFEALQVLAMAEAAFPGDTDLTFMRGRFAASKVPMWHLPMLADTERNELYRTAIEATIQPDDVVLDIGTGSGLLALMAARAGAKHVYACEADPILAGLARKIVEDNGYVDKVTVLGRHSTDLTVGRDMQEKVDVLITEIFDNAMIGEGVLPTMAHARAYLLKPDARIIPRRGKLYGQIVKAPHLSSFHSTKMVSGFDLSAMSAVSHPLSYKDVDFDFEAAEGCEVLSAPFLVWDLDLNYVPSMPFNRTVDVRVSASGEANAIIMWFDLHLAKGSVFSTRSTQPHQHWRRVAQLLTHPHPVAAGDIANLNIQYDRYFLFELS